MKSTALYLLCVKTDAIEVGIIIEKDVPTAHVKTIENIKKAKELGANCVELHTGKFCHLINNKKNYKNELIKIKNCANFGNSIGMDIHAGHGLNYSSTKKIVKIKYINELNIGHFIISNSIFYGLKKVIGNFKKILNK